MYRFVKIIALVICIVLTLPVVAQTVNGKWYGIGSVQHEGENSSYMAELSLKQRGKMVSGTFSYYFRDSLFNVRFTGSFDPKLHELHINRLPIIYYRSTSTKLGIDCSMTGSFTLLASRNESLLTGAFTSDNDHRHTVPDLKFRFRFSTDTAAILVEKGLDTTEQQMAKAAPATAVDSSSVIKLADFLARDKSLIKELEVAASTIRVELYDNGAIDYDSVSLFLNNKEVLPKSMLTHKAIRLSLRLDPQLEYNELSMYAENLGMIPPNTAAMIVYDGNIRHEIVLTSDLNKSATIRLKRKAHPPQRQ